MSLVKRSMLAVLALMLVLTVGAGWVISHGGGGPETIHGCVNPGGHLRIVSSTTNCKSQETALDWNVQGPPGATGATGPQGVTGATGSQGNAGATGPAGPGKAIVAGIVNASGSAGSFTPNWQVSRPETGKYVITVDAGTFDGLNCVIPLVTIWEGPRATPIGFFEIAEIACPADGSATVTFYFNTDVLFSFIIADT